LITIIFINKYTNLTAITYIIGCVSVNSGIIFHSIYNPPQLTTTNNFSQTLYSNSFAACNATDMVRYVNNILLLEMGSPSIWLKRCVVGMDTIDENKVREQAMERLARFTA